MNLESLKDWVKTTLQKTGYDLVQFRSINTVLSHHGVNVVLDVGANAGQYGLKMRDFGYKGKIISFEPQKSPFAALSTAAKRDGNWTAVNVGLGSEEGRMTINVHENSCMSSMLNILSPDGTSTSQQPTEEIEIRTLDSLINQHVKPSDKVLLKIDTQGFEKQVLQGAEKSFARLAGIQIEMSMSPLYAGQPLLDEMIALLRSKGFTLWQIHRGFYHQSTGQEMEADGVFMRTESATT